MLRATLAGLVDFSRIIVMRSGSDFDRQPPGLTAYDNLFTDVGAFLPSLANLYNVGVLIVEGIISNWDSTFEAGIPRKAHLSLKLL
jgi:purine nucleoside permease